MPQFMLTHRGTIAGVEDEFSHSLVVNGAGDEQSVAEAAVLAFYDNAWLASSAMRTRTSPTVTYTEVTAAQILSLSEGTLSAAFHAPINPAGATGTGTSALPAQIAAAVSLTAGTRLNGTPIKGRFFTPVPSSSAIDADGLYTEGWAQSLLDSYVDYFQALGTAGLDVGVWSRSDASFTPLTLVRVGRTPDTIRTRRNALPEEYLEATP